MAALSQARSCTACAIRPAWCSCSGRTWVSRQHGLRGVQLSAARSSLLTDEMGK